MALQDTQNPNLNCYNPRNGGRYLATRLVTHNGVTVAIAMGRSEKRAPFFEYSILNPAADADRAKADAQPPKPSASPGLPSTTTEAEKLDSQCWLENAKTLIFSSEVRVVGEDAVPVYEIPAIDGNGAKVGADRHEMRDPWTSTTLCLMDEAIASFEVLSDGKYIYLFRQAVALTPATSLPNPFMKPEAAGMPPADGNLLCDRFTLVGSSLQQTLEARYRRSRQKRIPLNEQDTLGVRDINDKFFYEPTYSLRFIPDLVDGRFSVLRVPTATNEIFRWVFLSYSSRSRQIEYLTTDVAADGLFDLHGQIYYTCDSVTHPGVPVFATAPGSCTAIISSGKREGEACSKPKIPLVPRGPLAQYSLKTEFHASLRLEKPIGLGGGHFQDGFVLEAWIRPKSFWNNTDDSGGTTSEREAKEDGSGKPETGVTSLPPAGYLACIFPQSEAKGVQLLLNDELQLILCTVDSTESLAKSPMSLKPDTWVHVALTYSGSAGRKYAVVVDGATDESAVYTLPPEMSPGVLDALASSKDRPERHFIGNLDEVRLWNRWSHPSTIKERMHKRATGMEQFLEACWHFDEGAGVTAFDASYNHHRITISTPDGKYPPSDLWETSAAQLVASHGLSRRLLRLPSNIEVCGGLGATLYNEQVTVARPVSETRAGSEAPKQMKRSTRMLLSFVARALDGSSTAPSRLAVFDFGILSDGMLCDTPAVLELPKLIPSSASSPSAINIPTSLLYIDPQGIEVFGGLLAHDVVQCGPESPHAFESATGTVALYYRSGSGTLSALNYDISRTVVISSESVLSGHIGLYAKSKLRHARNVTVRTERCPGVPKELAINLQLDANMSDGSKVTEKWTCKSSPYDSAIIPCPFVPQRRVWRSNLTDNVSIARPSISNRQVLRPCERHGHQTEI